MTQAITLEQAKQIVTTAGHKLGSAWEVDGMIYACGMESTPGTFGHPRFEVYQHAGWLSVSGRPTVEVKPACKRCGKAGEGQHTLGGYVCYPCFI
jgi:hypothetical protein